MQNLDDLERFFISICPDSTRIDPFKLPLIAISLSTGASPIAITFLLFKFSFLHIYRQLLPDLLSPKPLSPPITSSK